MSDGNDLARSESGEAEVDYPAGAPADEQRRAFVLEAIGSAASDMDSQTLCQMVVELAEMLRTGVPPAKRKLRPVS
jgi:hypothetical protein